MFEAGTRNVGLGINRPDIAHEESPVHISLDASGVRSRRHVVYLRPDIHKLRARCAWGLISSDEPPFGQFADSL
jgi:hypothetical protein